MSYLLAKIVFLLFLAALLGAALAWWFLRRRCEDVTVQYTSLLQDWAGWRKGLDEKLGRPQAGVDFEPVTTRLQQLEAQVRGIEIPRHVPTDLTPVLSAVAAVRIPQPAPPVDLAPVESRLGELEKLVRGIVIPVPKEPDFSAVLSRLAGLEAKVGGIRLPEPAPAVDLAPVAARIESVERAVAAIRIPSVPAAVDLGPVQARLADVEKAVKGISLPAPKEPDFAPLMLRLGGLESRFGAFKLPDPPPAVNLAPLQAQLDTVERAVAAIRIPPAPAPADMGPLQARLGEVEKAVKAIVIPAPKEPDFSAILSRLGGVETRLGAFKLPEAAPSVDLAPMQNKLDAVERAVAAIRMPAAPAPVDLAPLRALDARMAGLEAAVKGIRFPEAKEPDLSALASRLGGLETRLGALRMPEPAAAVDLAPVQARMAELERAVKGISFPAPKEPDLSALLSRFGAFETRLNSLRMPEAAPAVDLRPTHERMAAIEAALRGIVIPPPAKLDLGPLLERMGALESRLAGMVRTERTTERAAPRPAPAPKAAPVAKAALVAQAAPAIPRELVRAGSRNLLARPAFGRPDDLKLIKGVAGVLEKMLHGIGVYYFWQIAEWSASDIAYVDTQLTAFKGRIKRDEWKSQAVAFARRPESARKPRA